MNYITCLKWGDKYGPEYVNNLYKMVSRNITIPYEFICFTDNKQGIDKNITIRKLPKYDFIGWWFKPYFLSEEIGLEGTILFLDLDLIVFRNIDKLFEYNPDKFCIIRDFNRIFRQSWDRFNSSVFKLQGGSYNNVWEDFKRNGGTYVRQLQGDQDFLFKKINDHVFWPDEWIQSYKWEMRGRQHLEYVADRRDFKIAGDPQILPECSIAVFHGQPNIHDTIDTWPRSQWR